MLGTGIVQRLGLTDSIREVRRAWARLVDAPPLFHITHHKAGSQWIHAILRDLVQPRLVRAEVAAGHFLERPIQPARVYPTLYITRQQFESVEPPRRHRKFIIIRDLRDTLVSLYYSLKYSHQMLTPRMQSQRQVLEALEEEEGLLYLIGSGLPPMAQIQWSWVNSNETLIRYEDLIERDEEILAPLLLHHCRLPVEPERVREAIRKNRFEARTGRKPGAQDPQSHQRKGIAGDWRNHFTDRVRAEFKRCYGSLLIASGYEKQTNW